MHGQLIITFRILQILAKHDILSAPLVLLPSFEDGGDINLSPQLLGWLDVQDILMAFLKHLEGCGHDIPVKMLALMNALEEEGPKFSAKTLVTMGGGEDRRLVYAADGASTSVLTAIQDFFLQQSENRVCHRIAMFDAHGEVTAIISQSDVVAWLVRNEQHLGRDLERTVEELGLLTGKPPVFSVNPYDPTLVAYAGMSRAGVSGAPVVADTGEMIANLSISDLRALTAEHFGALALPVAEFLALEHHTAYVGYAVQGNIADKQPLFTSSRHHGGPQKGDIALYTISPKATLRQVLHSYVEKNIHRLYVTGQSGGPLKVDSVLTLTDVLRYFAGVW